MKSGIFLIDKEPGVSSASVVGDLKRGLKLEKIGHAGTLDPMASGLLVCMVGKATRLASYAESGQKCYSGTIRFGLSTTSDDITGEVLERSENLPSISEVQAALAEFTGKIEQVPPKISAVKINGERAYKRTRRGEDIEISARPVEIFSFEVEEVDSNTISFEIECSKGTYIRSLARDLSLSLGTVGCLASLRRERSFPFEAQNAKKLAEVGIDDMVNWASLFPTASVVTVSDVEATQLLGGNDVLMRSVVARENLDSETGQAVVYRGEKSAPLGIFVRKKGSWSFGVNIG